METRNVIGTVNRNVEKYSSVNEDRLSESDAAIFSNTWAWFRTNELTAKDEPHAIASEEGSAHSDGLILIDPKDAKPHFPLGAVMSEEILHYITSTDDPETSADFSPKYLQSILTMIVEKLNSRNVYAEQRAFQSVLINELWRIIEKEAVTPL